MTPRPLGPYGTTHSKPQEGNGKMKTYTIETYADVEQVCSELNPTGRDSGAYDYYDDQYRAA